MACGFDILFSNCLLSVNCWNAPMLLPDNVFMLLLLTESLGSTQTLIRTMLQLYALTLNFRASITDLFNIEKMRCIPCMGYYYTTK